MLKPEKCFVGNTLHGKIKKWGTVLWTDEYNFFCFGSDGMQYVHRSPNKEAHIKTKNTVKFGFGSIHLITDHCL